MKTLLTILFFMDTLAFSVLPYLLLKLFDAKSHTGWLGFLLLLYGCCIFLLGYLLLRYLNLPPEKNPDLFSNDSCKEMCCS